MESINRQLNIEPTPRNSNYRSKMARGANTYQVQLGTEDPSLDYYNDIRAIESYKNANGSSWDLADGCRDIGNEMFSAKEEYTEFLGISYPPCANLRCKDCKNECKNVQGLKWRDGGKECHKGCVISAKNEQMDRIRNLESGNNSEPVKSGEIIPQEDQSTAGMSVGAKVGISVAVLAVVGVAIYMIRKKKS